MKVLPPLFLIEEYTTDHNDELNDYKFLCFDGIPYFCWVDTGDLLITHEQFMIWIGLTTMVASLRS